MGVSFRRVATASVAVGSVVALVAALVVLAPGATATGYVFSGSVSTAGPATATHRFEVGRPGTISLSLMWDTAGVDLNLSLTDALGRGVRTTTSTTVRPEVITVTSVVVGTWVATVRAKTGASSYTLTVNAPDAPTTPLQGIDMSAAAGVAQTTRSYGTYPADVNGDGFQDFLYNRHFGTEMLLLLNDGDGTFTARPAAGVFPINDRHDCVWAPLDGDALLDMYCAVGASGGRKSKANEVWLGTADGGFVQAPGAWGAADPYGRGREPALFDATGDGLLDLFVGNYYPRPDGQPTPNRFYVQDPVGSFRSAPAYGLDLQIGGQCAEPWDFSEDGRIDLMVCAHGQQGGLKLYRNDGQLFTNVSTSRGISGNWCDATWTDLNGDGRIDLAMMNVSTFQLMLQQDDGTFAVVYQRSMRRAGCKFGGGGNRIVAGDVDLDGDQDLYVVYSGYTSDAYNLDDLLLINEGSGTAYAQAALPTEVPGSGFSASPIDVDGDGASEFLVANGRGQIVGPLQLITLTDPTAPSPSESAPPSPSETLDPIASETLAP